MENRRAFISELMERLEFPREAAVVFFDLFRRVEEKPEITNTLKRLASDMVEKRLEIEDLKKQLNRLAKELSVHDYTMDLYFLMQAALPMREAYEKRKLPLSLYWDTIWDLKYKLMECHEVYEIWGTFVISWFPRFFQLERFALGRFQYELIEFPYESYERGNVKLKKGDLVYNLHIPSSGPMKKEDRLQSYQKAFLFYGKNPLVVVCNSWLLNPEHEVFLPKTSNILDFMKDFDIIDRKPNNTFTAAWRIFGKEHEKKPGNLPRNTSLQRAFDDWFLAGGEAGDGFGVLIFDGERIL